MNSVEQLIGIVIVNYNGADDTIACLASLALQTQQNYTAIVVDNASTDDSLSKLRAFNECETVIVESDSNRGFSGGNNLGIAKAFELGCEYIMFLNNDTIADKELVGNLLAACDDETVAAPYIYYYYDKNRLWYAGGYFDRFSVPRHRDCPERAVANCNYVSGCCFMASRGVIERVGLWDEDYFLYWEDADYSKRINNAGVCIEIAAEAILYHKVSASTGGDTLQSLYYQYRNKLLFCKRFRTGFISMSYAWLTVALKLACSGRKRSAALAAMSDYRRGRFGQHEL